MELLVLDVAQIRRIEQGSYAGRSQYPRCKYKPLIRNTKTKEYCPHLVFWGLVKQNIAHSTTMFEGGKERQESAWQISFMMASVERHISELPDHLKSEATILEKMLSIAFDNFPKTKSLAQLASFINSTSTKTCPESFLTTANL